jgi:ubiquinone biosynthesis protein
VNLNSDDLTKLQQEIRQASYRSAAATSGAAFLVGAAVIKGLDGYAPTMLAGLPILSWVFGIWGLGLLYFSLTNRN